MKPHVIVADAEMPRIGGLRSIGKSPDEGPFPKVVILTERFGRAVAVEQFRRGASAIVSKQGDANELLRAVRFAIAGKHYVSPTITPISTACLLREGTSCKRQRDITDRQQQIVRPLAQGMIAKEIAYSLGLSQATVYFHKNRVGPQHQVQFRAISLCDAARSCGNYSERRPDLPEYEGGHV